MAMAMADTINVTINRSSEWVRAQRLATGRNVPASIVVAVDPAELSKECRAKLISVHGDYREVKRLGYDQSYRVTTLDSGYHFGAEHVQIDADAPTVQQVSDAILAAFARVEAARLKSEAKAESEAQAKRKLAEEWASLPLSHRATVKGVAYCVDSSNTPADYRGPLSTSGTVRYPRDLIRQFAPQSWAEAEAEVSRLKAEAEAKSNAGREVLAAWTREHGSDLAKARLAEGYDCWMTVAHDDYAEAVAGRIAGGLELAEEPDGTDGQPVVELRKCPLLHEIQALRSARERIGNEPATVELAYVRYDRAGDCEDTDVPAKQYRTEIKYSITLPDGSAEERFYLIPQ